MGGTDRASKAVIGERIGAMRELLDMTQTDLARHCYVTQPTVSSWERGLWLPSRATQYRVADTLHVPRSRLFRELIEREERAVA